MSDRITSAIDGNIAAVTLDNPPNNHLSVDIVRELGDLLMALDAQPCVRCIVLQTNGKVFCAGADLGSRSGGTAGDDQAGRFYEQAIRLFSTQTPIVAAIQGAAIGAGLGLALTADFRVAAPEARLAASFVKLGYHPGFALTHTLPRLIGRQRAALLLLTGRRIKGEEAYAMGLVDSLNPITDLRHAAMTLAQELAENAPLAVAATRGTLRNGLIEAVCQQIAIEYVNRRPSLTPYRRAILTPLAR